MNRKVYFLCARPEVAFKRSNLTNEFQTIKIPESQVNMLARAKQIKLPYGWGHLEMEDRLPDSVPFPGDEINQFKTIVVKFIELIHDKKSV